MARNSQRAFERPMLGAVKLARPLSRWARARRASRKADSTARLPYGELRLDLRRSKGNGSDDNTLQKIRNLVKLAPMNTSAPSHAKLVDTRLGAATNGKNRLEKFFARFPRVTN
jgi:hypothetical protein